MEKELMEGAEKVEALPSCPDRTVTEGSGPGEHGLCKRSTGPAGQPRPWSLKVHAAFSRRSFRPHSRSHHVAGDKVSRVEDFPLYLFHHI